MTKSALNQYDIYFTEDLPGVLEMIRSLEGGREFLISTYLVDDEDTWNNRDNIIIISQFYRALTGTRELLLEAIEEDNEEMNSSYNRRCAHKIFRCDFSWLVDAFLELDKNPDAASLVYDFNPEYIKNRVTS